ICTLLWTVGRNANEGTSWYSPASRPSIAALAIFFIGLLTYSAAAQTSPQSLTTQARITHAISPQILAMHEIGRASCRERVYVSVVYVALENRVQDRHVSS